MHSRKTVYRFESLPAAPFYAGLVLSGMATVLLGPILPAISARWSLTDAQAGALFTAQFVGAILGSVVSSYRRRHSVVFGHFAIALGLAGLSINNYFAALAALVIMGIGIGGAVTATNLIFGTEYPEERGRLLSRTNLCWGLGAVSAPQFTGWAEHHHTLRPFLLTAALATLGVSLWLSPMLRGALSFRTQKDVPARDNLTLPLFLIFSAILFLYVGGETAIAGWISTYMHRFAGLTVAASSLTVSVFWFSILGGRLLAPLLLRRLSEFQLLLTSILAAILGLLPLFARVPVGVAIAAVVLSGMGCASVFPLSTSRLLARVGRSRRTGWIFAICGSGGAVLPWSMGLLSERSGSLRTAFLIPLGAMLSILLCTLLERGLPEPHSEDHLPQQ
ncbi:MFS transporter [Silvibacterium sp.]|uniref:MFS transporter n=1 Tax=Silvibacterium sp. TaxID=1964179 RepID=UPI0039E6C508